MEREDYKPEIKKLFSKMSTDCKITTNGMDLINELLQDLSSKLVDEILDIANGASNLLVTDARKAVNALFKNKLKRLALAEGNRVVSLYANGLIQFEYKRKGAKHKIFKPKKERRKDLDTAAFEYEATDIKAQIVKPKKKIEKAIDSAAFEFSRGIRNLTRLIFSGASIPPAAVMLLCEIIEEVAVKISDFAQRNGRNCIKQVDVRDAAVNFLPVRMSKHAIAEGAKMTFLYATGML